jgi:hypothetical protein
MTARLRVEECCIGYAQGNETAIARAATTKKLIATEIAKISASVTLSSD